MDRIDSTDVLKPHEIALRNLRMDKERYQLIMATLGLTSSDLSKFKSLLDNGAVKQLEEFSGHVTPDDFAKLPAMKLNVKKSSVSGKWIKDEEQYRVSDEHGYTEELNKAVRNIYPDFSEETQRIPVTLLLPSEIKQDEFKLLGSPSKWDFITVQNDDKHLKTNTAFDVDTLPEQAKHAFPLRLFLAFRFIGLADTLQTDKNGSRIFLELIRSLNIASHFDLLSHAKLKAWGKRYKQHSNLNSKLNTQHRRARELNSRSTPNSASQMKRKRLACEAVNAKINEIQHQIDQIDIEPIPSESAKIESAFYYAMPKNVRELLKLSNKASTYVFPTLKTKAEPELKFTSVCLGQPKKKDRNALLRSTDKMRVMLCYLCSMTSGTAITFYVDKNAYKGKKKTLGITSPTLILPEAWSELAKGLKQYNSSNKVSQTSDDSYEDGNLRANFTSAIHDDYLKKQYELLRLIPTLDSEKMTEF